MGFIDAFKRWSLARKGMSSGKKRRTATASESAVVGSIDKSRWLKIFIYLLFGGLTYLLVGFLAFEDTLFAVDEVKRGFVVGILVVAVVLLYHIRHQIDSSNREVVLMFGGIVAHIALLYGICCLIDVNSWPVTYRILLAPVAFAPMVHSILLQRYAGVFSTLSVSLLGCLLMPADLVFLYLIMNLIAGCIVVTLTRRVRRRGNVLRAGFYLGLAMLLMGLAFDLIQISHVTTQEGLQQEVIKMAILLAVGMLTGMIVSGLLPVLESLFTITTNISWLELSDLNHKLLRRLQLEAPGTYHHSMVMATLAESAAEEIGANDVMCRVCAYFHDIGKLKKPEYFIENQGEINPHDTLTPTMSAIIITAHVKDGVDMAIKHKLNPKIIDVIREHHGNSLVKYFYHKACEAKLKDEEKANGGLENKDDVTEVDEKNFRYPGPCPSSRESGIISLADCVESASRTIKKPTPQKIKNLVNDLVMDRVTSGQLDNSGLTLGEVKKISESFCSTLRSMMHTRIDYPKDDPATKKPKVATKGPYKAEAEKKEKESAEKSPHAPAVAAKVNA